MIDGQVDSKYSIYISKFILNVSVDTQYISIINKIKEEQLIYEGICYNGNINELGKLTTKLDIYLEQEVLCYNAGYNGDVHKDMYRELLGYIEEIYSGYRGEKRFINLWYSSDTKDEVEAYFAAAEKIIENGEVADPSRKPMISILEKTKTRSDVLLAFLLFLVFQWLKVLFL